MPCDLPTVSLLNETSLLVSFGCKASLETTAQVASAQAFVQQEHGNKITDSVPAYTSLMLCIDPEGISIQEFKGCLQATLQTWRQSSVQTPLNKIESGLVEIPVYYHHEVAPDLVRLANIKALPIEELIHLHQQQIYSVYTIGFAPGFAYMGNVNELIAEPRLATPRKRVAKGSVGIAGKQTGVYPQALPGGWNIIGRCPISLIEIDHQGGLKCLYKTGDRVKFYAIDREEFFSLGGTLSP